MTEIRLRDILWGGRIRNAYQAAVWRIATEAAAETKHAVHGSMLSSSSTKSLIFLDGGVRDTRGFFDSSCGMFLHGSLAKAYILYRLGFNARLLLKDKNLPSLEELEAQVR